MEIFSNELFVNIIHKDYPNISSEEVIWFNDGWDHVIGVVENEIAYRFPRREDYLKKLPIEVKFIQLIIDKLPLSIPNLKLETDRENSFVYATYQYITGEQLSRNIFQELSENEQKNIAQQVGFFLSTLHSFDINKAKEIGIKHEDMSQVWTQRLIRIRNVVFPHIPKNEQMWIEAVFAMYFNTLKNMSFREVVIHGDIAPEHILLDFAKHSISGVIDFGDISISDPAYDFFQLSYYYGEEFLKNVYHYYHVEKDSLFDERRKFYQNRWPVTNLEHSIFKQDKELIEIHKKQLSKYIQKVNL